MDIDVTLMRSIEWADKYLLVEKNYKSSELACIPRVGDGWEDSSFIIGGIPHVDEVVFNYEGGYCIVYLEVQSIEEVDKDFIERIITSYEEGNWSINEVVNK